MNQYAHLVYIDAYVAVGGSGSGWGVEWSSSSQKVVGSIVSLPHLHAEVSSGKTLIS